MKTSIVLLCLLSMACDNGNDRQIVTVKYWQDFDKFSVVDARGTPWYPLNLADEFKVDGLQCLIDFTVSYPPTEGCAVCGQSVIITNIEAIP